MQTPLNKYLSSIKPTACGIKYSLLFIVCIPLSTMLFISWLTPAIPVKEQLPEIYLRVMIKLALLFPIYLATYFSISVLYNHLKK